MLLKPYIALINMSYILAVSITGVFQAVDNMERWSKYSLLKKYRDISQISCAMKCTSKETCKLFGVRTQEQDCYIFSEEYNFIESIKKDMFGTLHLFERRNIIQQSPGILNREKIMDNSASSAQSADIIKSSLIIKSSQDSLLIEPSTSTTLFSWESVKSSAVSNTQFITQQSKINANNFFSSRLIDHSTHVDNSDFVSSVRSNPFISNTSKNLSVRSHVKVSFTSTARSLVVRSFESHSLRGSSGYFTNTNNYTPNQKISDIVILATSQSQINITSASSKDSLTTERRKQAEALTRSSAVSNTQFIIQQSRRNSNGIWSSRLIDHSSHIVNSDLVSSAFISNSSKSFSLHSNVKVSFTSTTRDFAMKYFESNSLKGISSYTNYTPNQNGISDIATFATQSQINSLSVTSKIDRDFLTSVGRKQSDILTRSSVLASISTHSSDTNAIKPNDFIIEFYGSVSSSAPYARKNFRNIENLSLMFWFLLEVSSKVHTLCTLSIFPLDNYCDHVTIGVDADGILFLQSRTTLIKTGISIATNHWNHVILVWSSTNSTFTITVNDTISYESTNQIVTSFEGQYLILQLAVARKKFWKFCYSTETSKSLNGKISGVYFFTYLLSRNEITSAFQNIINTNHALIQWDDFKNNRKSDEWKVVH